MDLTTTSETEGKLTTRSSELIAAASRAVIDSAEAMSKGADLTKFIKATHNKAEDERKILVKPFNDGVKAINARFKEITGPLKNAETEIKGKMLSYQQEQNRLAQIEADRVKKEEEDKALEEAERLAEEGEEDQAEEVLTKAEEALPPAVEKAAPSRGDYGGVASVKKTWTYEVTDIKLLAEKHPELVVEISSEINKLIRGKDGARDIPGLRIFEKESMAIR